MENYEGYLKNRISLLSINKIINNYENKDKLKWLKQKITKEKRKWENSKERFNISRKRDDYFNQILINEDEYFKKVIELINKNLKEFKK